VISELLLAIGFLTRLPSGSQHATSAREVARAARWFPLVGALLGAIAVASFWIFRPLFPPTVTAVLIVAIDAAVTGAMHFDGLADTADGFGGGRTVGDMLRIMRDHTIGSYGAVAVATAIALKVSAITALASGKFAVAALFLAPVLGRWSAVLLSASEVYARPPEHDGSGAAGAPVRFIGRRELIVTTVTAVAFAAAARWYAVAALFLVAAFSVAWGRYCRRRIGGVTGDTLGAAIEISECLVLLLFTAVR
jgi:cobalamin 5'-phosphate synthase/cobalamin synthase